MSAAVLFLLLFVFLPKLIQWACGADPWPDGEGAVVTLRI